MHIGMIKNYVLVILVGTNMDNTQNINEFINEGSFQEYDYNEETKECEWKQVHEKSNKQLKERLEVDYHVWGG